MSNSPPLKFENYESASKNTCSYYYFFFSFSTAEVQVKFASATTIATDIKKVIDDYPNHFENLTGEVVIQNPQSTDYPCNFKISGAEEAIITRYGGKRNCISWHAVMLTTESFNEAKENIIHFITNLTIFL